MLRGSIERMEYLRKDYPERGIYIVYDYRIPGGEYVVSRNTEEEVEEFIKQKYGITGHLCICPIRVINKKVQ